MMIFAFYRMPQLTQAMCILVCILSYRTMCKLAHIPYTYTVSTYALLDLDITPCTHVHVQLLFDISATTSGEVSQSSMCHKKTL